MADPVSNASASPLLLRCESDVAAPAATAAPAKQATSPGLLGQVLATLSSLSASGQKVASPLKLKARNAVNAFLAEKNQPTGDDQHKARVNALKNAAICAVQELNQEVRLLIPPNRDKISDAEELGRQAWETILGKAEATNKIALDKYHELFALKTRLKARLNHGEAVTPKEKQDADTLISQANEAALTNVNAWLKANEPKSGSDSEPYANAKLCVGGLVSAEETSTLISKSAAETRQLVKALDPREAQPATSKR